MLVAEKAAHSFLMEKKMSFNRIILEGNLGKDVDFQTVAQGTLARATFPVATAFKPKNGEEVTTWFQITLLGWKAEHANANLSKGSRVFIEGRLQSEQWVDKEGNNRTALKVVGERYHMIAKGNEVGSDQNMGGSETEDEVPF